MRKQSLRSVYNVLFCCKKRFLVKNCLLSHSIPQSIGITHKQCLSQRPLVSRRTTHCKQILIIVGIFLTALFLPAVAEEPLFSAGPTPTQSYRSASHNAINNLPVLSSAQPPESVTAASPLVVSVDTNNNPALSSKQIAHVNMQEQLTEATQATAEYEQQTDTRIQNLADNNHAIGAAIQAITQQMLHIQMQMKLLQAQLGSRANVHSNATTHPLYFLGQKDNTIYFDIAAVVIFFTALIVMAMRYFQQKPLSETMLSEKEVEKGDYDFMGTAEAIPAKLDLARSYITMGEYDAAKKILQSVMASDDQERSLEATLLFDRISAKTK